MSYPPLLRLPTELHDQIISHLQDACIDGSDAALLSMPRLRLTNRYFHNLIPAPDHATLLRLEQSLWALQNSLYTCCHCVRLQPPSAFADTMMLGKKRRGGPDYEKRFCADCGFAQGKKYQGYCPGSEARVDGVWWVWCIHCREVKNGAEAGERRCHKACKACFDTLGCRCRQSCENTTVVTVPQQGCRVPAWGYGLRALPAWGGQRQCLMAEYMGISRVSQPP
jgi:hypothetical protein